MTRPASFWKLVFIWGQARWTLLEAVWQAEEFLDWLFLYY